MESDKSIMERLKEETWPEHDRAENEPLEKELVSGRLARGLYMEYLGQRMLVHRALEGHLRRLRESDRRAAGIFDESRFHEDRAAADLGFFGIDTADVKPSQATGGLVRMLEGLAAKRPVALLGVMYVLEGSTNGARYIARALRKSYGLPEIDGTRYLDPYGEEQRARWAAFKAAMDGTDFTVEECDEIVEAARDTFRHMVRIDRAINEK